MSKDLEKEYVKTFNELAEKYNLKNKDDEEILYRIFNDFYKKYKKCFLPVKKAFFTFLYLIF